MKKLIFSLLVAAASIHAQSQSPHNTIKVVSLDKETVSLNGGIRSDFGGKSRVVIPIDLPPNTVEWFYTFSTTPTGQPGVELNLVEQLLKLTAGPSGMLSLVASAIVPPSGAKACDIYLMNEVNSQAFLAKMDQKGGTLLFIESAKRENIRNGTIKIDDIHTGRWFLGLRNPSADMGIVINIEVAAIVEEKDADALQKGSLYGNMGWDAYKDGDLDKCIEFSRKALNFNSSLGWVKLNLGLCFLIKGDQETASNYYVDAIADLKKLPNVDLIRKHLQAGIDDIESARQKKSNIKGTDYIEDLLKQELQKQHS